MKKNSAGLGSLFWVLPFIFLLWFTLQFVFDALAQKTDIQTDSKSYEEFNRSVIEAIELEQANIGRRKNQIAELKAGLDELKKDVNSYRLQISTHSNLMMSPVTELAALEKADAMNRTALDQVKRRLKDIALQIEQLSLVSIKNDEQSRLNKEQLLQIQTQRPALPKSTAVVKNIKTLLQLLSEKRSLLNNLLEEYKKQKNTFEELQTSFSSLDDAFESEIKKRKKELLFQRGDTPLRITQWRRVFSEIDQIRLNISKTFSAEFWREELTSLWEVTGFLLFTILLLFLIAISVLFRVKRYVKFLMEQPFYMQRPWRRIAFQVFAKSLPLLGSVVFLYAFTITRNISATSFLFPLKSMLWAIIYTRWCLDALSLLSAQTPPSIPQVYIKRLKSLARTVRFFAVIYVAMDWMVVGTSLILLALRVIFEVKIVLWGLSIRKQLEKQYKDPIGPGVQTSNLFLRAATFLSYVVIGISPLLELAGFGEFALYWYLSWGRTIITLLWGTLLFLVLCEWDQPFTVTEAKDDKSITAPTAQPIRWILFRICWLLWAVLLLMALLFSWGARQSVLGGIFSTLQHQFQVGQMQFSIMGFIYAFLLFFFTHLLVKTLRYLLREKLLTKSGMERGLQESITNIIAYLTWGFGLLLAMHTIGFNTASLAVVLGALGIGLGFGLQNIFNNFISGIILLFERPIQVGDDVEINGTWAMVQKINVRSTVVQTYDNASLIIPNSEFISSQVTNWSFRDRRLRRKIVVGVAYGSDTALVTKTLLEIADKTPKVLKRPAPDVIFSDFADSALIFTLRVWTVVDVFLKVESSIRYEIDRLFKERNIIIAFPQRDVHIFNTNEQEKAPITLSDVEAKQS